MLYRRAVIVKPRLLKLPLWVTIPRLDLLKILDL
jgi:hypothetical protein